MSLEEKSTVKLISAEGFEFIIDRDAAMISNTIKNMLSTEGAFVEKEVGEINFPTIRAQTLEKVCQYFYYKLRYRTEEKPPRFTIEPSLALELMMAANYLDT